MSTKTNNVRAPLKLRTLQALNLNLFPSHLLRPTNGGIHT